MSYIPSFVTLTFPFVSILNSTILSLDFALEEPAKTTPGISIQNEVSEPFLE